MRTKLFIPVISLLCVSYALANPGPGEVPFDFEFTAPGGEIPEIDFDGDLDGISAFPLTMNSAEFPDGIASILSLELQLTGLSHTYPDDMEVYLIDPFGETLLVMFNRGNGVNIDGITLIFNDSGGRLPLDYDNSALDPSIPGNLATYYRPEGAGGMSNFVKQSGGTDTWNLLIIDGVPDDGGSLESWTLRGTAVPEPVTLSLLALGALTFLRRRRS